MKFLLAPNYNNEIRCSSYNSGRYVYDICQVKLRDLSGTKANQSEIERQCCLCQWTHIN